MGSKTKTATKVSTRTIVAVTVPILAIGLIAYGYGFGFIQMRLPIISRTISSPSITNTAPSDQNGIATTENKAKNTPVITAKQVSEYRDMHDGSVDWPIYKFAVTNEKSSDQYGSTRLHQLVFYVQATNKVFISKFRLTKNGTQHVPARITALRASDPTKALNVTDGSPTEQIIQSLSTKESSESFFVIVTLENEEVIPSYGTTYVLNAVLNGALVSKDQNILVMTNLYGRVLNPEYGGYLLNNRKYNINYEQSSLAVVPADPFI
ncbi:MAG: hypothetical protein NUV81_03980, partial [bacterium]|nr:hypothetical protein [bacterium]